ncbi:MAG: hypothetical protein EBU81_02195, partial [Proteobacteria bacterium]|nr:hypothetical protein [Pseudomonadota bacterium]
TALRPLDFKLASDVAQTWYGVKPAPATHEVSSKAAELAVIESGLGAWTNALRLATLDEEREGVRLHMARWQIKAGRWAAARTHLDAVTNAVHSVVKQRLERNWREKQGLPLENGPSNGSESPVRNPVGNDAAGPVEKP